MCTTCGCNPDEPINLLQIGHTPRQLTHRKAVGLKELEWNILSKNDLSAEHNRKHFKKKHILALNMVSSPGSGKTTLLEKTILKLKDEHSFYVVEGDQHTMNDALRIQASGAQAVQINTGKACHLDADMVHDALHQLEPADHSICIIENVGNLVCPALFDLGEKYRIVIMSVTEGEDKPLKYPYMFESSHVCIINKIDLLPYLDYNLESAKENAHKINHRLKFFELSSTKEIGLSYWLDWIREEHTKLSLH